MLHSRHFGLRAWQIRRPCQISWWENWIHLFCGMIFIKSCSTFLGSSFRDKSRRLERRSTCVSTTTPLAIPYAVPSTTLPVFSRHARQREDFFHGARHLPAKLFKDRFARAHHRFRLVPEKSCRPDVLLQLAWRGVCERFRIWIFFIKRFSYLIDAHIRALRGKNRRH